MSRAHVTEPPAVRVALLGVSFVFLTAVLFAPLHACKRLTTKRSANDPASITDAIAVAPA